MVRIRFVCATLASFVLVGLVLAGDGPVPLATAQGLVEKVDKNSLTIQPRSAQGRVQMSLVLKLTGTSRVTAVTLQKRAGKLVPVQKDLDAKDLQPNQQIAVIYTPDKTGGTMLSAVAQTKAP